MKNTCQKYLKRIRLVQIAAIVFSMAGSLALAGCGSAGSDQVTLIFKVVDSECQADAHVGANHHDGGMQVPGMPISYGDSAVTYVYSGGCPSEGIYISSIEIGGTHFITDYYFNCRADPYNVEVYFTGSYCNERVIE